MGNRQIGEVFDLIYSSVSKIVSNFRKRYGGDGDLEKDMSYLLQNSRFDIHIKSLLSNDDRIASHFTFQA